MAAVPDGFEVPVFQCLLRPRLLWGAPRTISVLTITMAGMAFIWSYWPVFPILAVFQGAAIVGTWVDEDWLDIAFRVLFLHRHYEA